ncbi:MAG TPA: type II 3-dehydroquinate dehydratase [Mycobacteriales bacterium]|nr:type II 3-dehydroquinate dehydratase [Mycobacteriales bacterium]
MTGERVLVLNGPNLDLLGRREPGVYGSASLADVRAALEALARELGCSVELRQTNSEGQLVDWVHEAWDAADGIVVNPGALAHYSYALRDAIAAVPRPTVEVHISNVHARERFRHHSTVSPVAVGVIVGMGTYGYELALRGLVERLRAGAPER